MSNTFQYLIFLFALSLTVSCSTESTPVYQLTTSVEPSEAGTVTPATSEVEEGDSVEVSATANEHWVFDSWSGDYSGTDNPASIVMDADKSVTALFVKQDYPLTIEKVGEGTISQKVVQSKTTDYPYGTIVELTAESADGWKFIEWSGDASSTNEVIEVNIDGETNLTVTFERIEYPLTITIEGEGEVVQEIVSAPKITEYPFETVVELNPIPSDGYRFVEWSGDVSGDESPLQITIDGEKNITAKFSPIAFLAENGITIMCPYAEVGDIGIVNGIEYEVVDRDLLEQRRDEESDLTKVCVTLVYDMSLMFDGIIRFNQPIGGWDVSNVTNMRGMFKNSQFNSSIKNWNVSNVTIMNEMFYGSSFNQPIGGWDVSNTTNMSMMFKDSPFNNTIKDWDVSNVRDMSGMFWNSSFNQPIEKWDVSSVIRMNVMFRNSAFNQPIGGWNVSNVENMGGMFKESSFNQPIGGWDVGSVTSISGMFMQSGFNQPIGDWDVSNVTNMNQTFWMNRSFNQPIGGWDVSSVTNMNGMFYLSHFNQDISGWCVFLIKSTPLHFSDRSALAKENKPVWGTCPD